ncbi:Fe-S protein assembly co-chaperone HscB [Ramlibacter sp.]|uniref:Fe-S protein assembly co-chaperone HscB n=1 Tax=Ramlibacter sp. TaxID=1917967 RepID=UPI00260DDCDE|nr:Fe-S protein assembly co-chaperone HscB [Ramlibacter sp.]MDB5957773.1 hscB [Ramlibacter sp.]
MKLNLQSSDFELFGLPEQFHQSGAALDERWKELQREVHPDKFAAQGTSAQRIAMQWSVRVNEAYKRLRDPLQRAAYLCERRGAPINAETNTAMPAEFLAGQMAWREALDDACSEEDLDRVATELARARSETLEQIGALLDTTGDPPAAAQQVRALMFIERFAHDVETRVEQLGQ